MKIKKKIENALLDQASFSLSSGSRFQFRVDEIGGHDDVKKFITSLSMRTGLHVRGSVYEGLLTIYSDETDGTSVTVATIKR